MKLKELEKIASQQVKQALAAISPRPDFKKYSFHAEDRPEGQYRIFQLYMDTNPQEVIDSREWQIDNNDEEIEKNIFVIAKATIHIQTGECEVELFPENWALYIEP